jgi:hypothetical protein
VLDAINKYATEKIEDIPIWWDRTLPKNDRPRQRETNWKELESMNGEIAVRGLAPVGLSNFLQVSGHVPKDKITAALKDVLIVIATGFRDIWTKRCKIHYTCNPPHTADD